MNRFVFTLVLVLFLSHPAFAQDAADDLPDPATACEAFHHVTVTVTPRFDDPVYDYSASMAGITHMSQDVHHSIHETITLGLTHYQPMLSIEAPIYSIQLPSGISCATLDHVNVTVGFQDVVVYIANEIPQDSCGFDEVMGHEQKHINVNAALLQEYVPKISAELEAYLEQNSVFLEEDRDYAVNELREKLQDIVDSVMQQMDNENVARQSQVDTVEEYTRVSNSCNGQLRQIIATRGPRPGY